MKLKQLLASLLMATTLCANAANDIVTVDQVTDAVTLTDNVDYTITGAEPFATTGSVDIVNTEHAVLVFEKIKPSKVIASWLGSVTINGEPAKNGTNCWVEIYRNGTIVYPHAELDFLPLTVYTEAAFSGEEQSNFKPYTKYTSGSWVDNIKSFRLKRGYMATIATNPNGQGWSKVFIAQDHDLDIDFTKQSYGKYIVGKAGFIRVFPWRNVTKKGTAGNPGLQDELNITWFYGWNGDGWHNDMVEHIPQHHHEGWPSWSGINGLNSCNTVLGNNEPDNQSDQREQYIKPSEIEERMFGVNGTWQNEAYSGGLRVGSPAMSGDCRGTWLSTFMDLCKKYNCRIDFIADHCYWLSDGGSFNWQMNETYKKYGRPIWITEWNYGANWTNWPGSDTSGSDANQQIELKAVSDIVTNLENNPYVERYAFYNWVQDCRSITLNGKLTKAGEWYAKLKSNSAYADANEYTMGWTYWEPSDLTITMNKKNATLAWTHLNGKQTDRIVVQCKVVNEENKWIEIADLGMEYKSSMTVTNSKVPALNLADKSGLIYFRIANHDSDGKTRYSNEVSVTLGSGEGTDAIQYGKAATTTSEAFAVEYSQTFSESPCVFIGTVTNKNAKFLFGNNLSASDKAKFTFQLLPWLTSTEAISKNEEVPFLVLKPGNYQFGEMDCEVGTAKSGKASGTNLWSDEAEITFAKPFAEGVVPVVLTEIKKPSYSTKTALSVRVFDVTNTGFKLIVYPEDKSGQKVALPQNNINYLAIAPGFGYADEENGIIIAAGHGSNQVFGLATQEVSFTANDEQLMLYSPVVLTALQTNNYPTACTLRRTDATEKDDAGTTWTKGTKVKRVLDHAIKVDGKDVSTSTSLDQYKDNIGWVAVASYREGGSQPISTDIKNVNSDKVHQLSAHAENGVIKVAGAGAYSIINMSGAAVSGNTQLPAGVYVVKAGAESVKVVVK